MMKTLAASCRTTRFLSLMTLLVKGFPMVRVRFVPVLAAVLALVALAACERLAGPDRTARPPASGPEVNEGRSASSR